METRMRDEWRQIPRAEVLRIRVSSSICGQIIRDQTRDETGLLNLHQHGVLVLRRMETRMRDEEGTGSPVHLFCMPFSPAHTITKLTIQDQDELDSYLIQIKPIITITGINATGVPLGTK